MSLAKALDIINHLSGLVLWSSGTGESVVFDDDGNLYFANPDGDPANNDPSVKTDDSDWYGPYQSLGDMLEGMISAGAIDKIALATLAQALAHIDDAAYMSPLKTWALLTSSIDAWSAGTGDKVVLGSDGNLYLANPTGNPATNNPVVKTDNTDWYGPYKSMGDLLDGGIKAGGFWPPTTAVRDLTAAADIPVNINVDDEDISPAAVKKILTTMVGVFLSTSAPTASDTDTSKAIKLNLFTNANGDIVDGNGAVIVPASATGGGTGTTPAPGDVVFNGSQTGCWMPTVPGMYEVRTAANKAIIHLNKSGIGACTLVADIPNTTGVGSSSSTTPDKHVITAEGVSGSTFAPITQITYLG